MRDLSRLLRPQSIAVVGGKWSANVLRQCRKMGFQGDLWPIHPTRDTIEGLACYKSVADLPAAPDASFIGVNRDASIQILRELAERGAGGAVCFASGFGEVTDGAARQADLVAAAADMPFLGPNCYGFINYLDGALMWPDQHGGIRVDRGVAIIVQSSNIAINMTMHRRGLPIAYLLTAGNQAQTGVSDLIEATLADPRVTAIGLHLEGFDDPPRMEAAMRHARDKGVPIVALKVGKSQAAQAMTLSHTASLAGPEHLSDAFFARAGVARVRTLDEFVETLKLLHVLGPSPDMTLGSMSCSGGEASLVGDLAEAAGLQMPPLTDAQAAALRATLNPMVTISNPLDYHTFHWGDGPAMTATYAAMLDCRHGLDILVMDFPRLDRCDDNGSETALDAAIAAHAMTPGARFAVVASLPENMTEDIARKLMDSGIAPLMGLDTAMSAAAHAARIGTARPPKAPMPRRRPAIPRGEVITLHEAEAKDLLAASGMSRPAGRFAADADAAVAAAEELGYPVVLKAVSRDLPHKTEFGAVALHLHDAEAVRAAAGRMARLNAPFLVERMVTGAVAELILGIGRDPALGHYLTIGTGGILVELWNDMQSLLLPVDRDQVRAALAALRSAPLLAGYRGHPAAPIERIVDAAMAVADFAAENADTLEELDINPLMVTPEDAIAADALLRMRPTEEIS
ncbi:acetate--CoA ligase family protein [Paracoccus pacificus]|uniref:Acetate--CoA ligase family protein n=1 Tax=Paracoccus pacificus TaxID=1463598 RepID=A0ABW4R2P1_9RHOB